MNEQKCRKWCKIKIFGGFKEEMCFIKRKNKL